MTKSKKELGGLDINNMPLGTDIGNESISSVPTLPDMSDLKLTPSLPAVAQRTEDMGTFYEQATQAPGDPVSFDQAPELFKTDFEDPNMFNDGWDALMKKYHEFRILNTERGLADVAIKMAQMKKAKSVVQQFLDNKEITQAEATDLYSKIETGELLRPSEEYSPGQQILNKILGLKADVLSTDDLNTFTQSSLVRGLINPDELQKTTIGESDKMEDLIAKKEELTNKIHEQEKKKESRKIAEDRMFRTNISEASGETALTDIFGNNNYFEYQLADDLAGMVSTWEGMALSIAGPAAASLMKNIPKAKGNPYVIGAATAAEIAAIAYGQYWSRSAETSMESGEAYWQKVDQLTTDKIQEIKNSGSDRDLTPIEEADIMIQANEGLEQLESKNMALGFSDLAQFMLTFGKVPGMGKWTSGTMLGKATRDVRSTLAGRIGVNATKYGIGIGMSRELEGMEEGMQFKWMQDYLGGHNSGKSGFIPHAWEGMKEQATYFGMRSGATERDALYNSHGMRNAVQAGMDMATVMTGSGRAFRGVKDIYNYRLAQHALGEDGKNLDTKALSKINSDILLEYIQKGKAEYLKDALYRIGKRGAVEGFTEDNANDAIEFINQVQDDYTKIFDKKSPLGISIAGVFEYDILKGSRVSPYSNSDRSYVFGNVVDIRSNNKLLEDLQDQKNEFQENKSELGEFFVGEHLSDEQKTSLEQKLESRGINATPVDVLVEELEREIATAKDNNAKVATGEYTYVSKLAAPGLYSREDFETLVDVDSKGNVIGGVLKQISDLQQKYISSVLPKEEGAEQVTFTKEDQALLDNLRLIRDKIQYESSYEFLGKEKLRNEDRISKASAHDTLARLVSILSTQGKEGLKEILPSILTNNVKMDAKTLEEVVKLTQELLKENSSLSEQFDSVDDKLDAHAGQELTEEENFEHDRLLKEFEQTGISSQPDTLADLRGRKALESEKRELSEERQTLEDKVKANSEAVSFARQLLSRVQQNEEIHLLDDSKFAPKTDEEIIQDIATSDVQDEIIALENTLKNNPQYANVDRINSLLNTIKNRIEIFDLRGKSTENQADKDLYQGIEDTLRGLLDLVAPLQTVIEENNASRIVGQVEAETDAVTKLLLPLGMDAEFNFVEGVYPEIQNIVQRLIPQEKIDFLKEAIETGAITDKLMAANILVDLLKFGLEEQPSFKRELTASLTSSKSDLVSSIKTQYQSMRPVGTHAAEKTFISNPAFSFFTEAYSNFLAPDTRVLGHPYFAYEDHLSNQKLLRDLNNAEIMPEMQELMMLQINVESVESMLQNLESPLSSASEILTAEALLGSKLLSFLPTKQQLNASREIASFLNTPTHKLGKGKGGLGSISAFLQGAAGTGKTKVVIPLALALAGVSRANTYTFGHNESSSEVLSTALGTQNKTLQDFLKESESFDSNIELLIIDEAPGITTENLFQIQTAVEAINSTRESSSKLKVLFLGDPAQITEAGQNSMRTSRIAFNMAKTITPVTAVYRSDNPAITEFQDTFRRRSSNPLELVINARATSDRFKTLDETSQTISGVIGVAGDFKSEILPRLEKLEDVKGKKRVIITNINRVGEYQTFLEANNIKNTEVLSYVDAQGPTMNEVYMDIRPDEFVEPVTGGVDNKAYNKALYTASSRAQDLILAGGLNIVNSADANLENLSAGLSQEIVDRNEQYTAETKANAEFIKGFPVLLSSADAENITLPEETKEAPEASVPPATPAEEQTDEGVAFGEETEGIDLNTVESSEIEEESYDTGGSTIIYTPKPKQGNSTRSDALAFPESYAFDPSIGEKGENIAPVQEGVSVIFVKTEIEKKGGEVINGIGVYQQAYQTMSNGEVDLNNPIPDVYKRVAILGLDELDTGLSLFTPSQKNALKVALSSDTMGNQFTQYGDDRSTLLDSDGDAQNVNLLEGFSIPHGGSQRFKFKYKGQLQIREELRAQNPNEWVKANKGLLSRILSKFKSGAYTDSQGPKNENGIELELKTFTRSDIENLSTSYPDISAAATKTIRPGRPYLIIRNAQVKNSAPKAFVVEMRPRLISGSITADRQKYYAPVEAFIKDVSVYQDLLEVAYGSQEFHNLLIPGKKGEEATISHIGEHLQKIGKQNYLSQALELREKILLHRFRERNAAGDLVGTGLAQSAINVLAAANKALRVEGRDKSGKVYNTGRSLFSPIDSAYSLSHPKNRNRFTLERLVQQFTDVNGWNNGGERHQNSKGEAYTTGLYRPMPRLQQFKDIKAAEALVEQTLMDILEEVQPTKIIIEKTPTAKAVEPTPKAQPVAKIVAGKQQTSEVNLSSLKSPDVSGLVKPTLFNRDAVVEFLQTQGLSKSDSELVYDSLNEKELKLIDQGKSLNWSVIQDRINNSTQQTSEISLPTETVTDKKGRTYTYFENTQTKGGTVKTTYTFNRSDKDSSQRNTSGVKPEIAIDNKGYKIVETYVPEGTRVNKVYEVRVDENDQTKAGADVQFINENGDTFRGDVQLQLVQQNADTKLSALEQPTQQTSEVKPGVSELFDSNKAVEPAPRPPKQTEEKSIEIEKEEEDRLGGLLDDFTLDFTDNRTGLKGNKVTRQQALKLLKRLMPDMFDKNGKIIPSTLVMLDALRMEKMTGNTNTLGRFSKGIIFLLEDKTGIYENVVRHEALHKVIWNYLTDSERASVFAAARARYNMPAGKFSNKEVEEKLADEFMVARQAPQSLPKVLQSFFKKVLKFFGFFQKNEDNIDAFFNNIENGYFSGKMYVGPSEATMNSVDIKKHFGNNATYRYARDMFSLLMADQLDANRRQASIDKDLQIVKSAPISREDALQITIQQAANAVERLSAKSAKDMSVAESTKLNALRSLSNPRIAKRLFQELYERDLKSSSMEMEEEQDLDTVNLKDIIERAHEKDHSLSLAQEVVDFLSGLNYLKRGSKHPQRINIKHGYYILLQLFAGLDSTLGSTGMVEEIKNRAKKFGFIEGSAGHAVTQALSQDKGVILNALQYRIGKIKIPTNARFISDRLFIYSEDSSTNVYDLNYDIDSQTEGVRIVQRGALTAGEFHYKVWEAMEANGQTLSANQLKQLYIKEKALQTLKNIFVNAANLRKENFKVGEYSGSEDNKIISYYSHRSFSNDSVQRNTLKDSIEVNISKLQAGIPSILKTLQSKNVEKGFSEMLKLVGYDMALVNLDMSRETELQSKLVSFLEAIKTKVGEPVQVYHDSETDKKGNPMPVKGKFRKRTASEILDDERTTLRLMGSSLRFIGQGQKPQSIRTVEGNILYAYHNSSFGADALLGLTPKKKDSDRKEYLQKSSPAYEHTYKFNIFANGDSQIYNMSEHDGIKSESSFGEPSVYRKEDSADWSDRNFNYFFAADFRYVNAAKGKYTYKYTQQLHTVADAPNLKAAEVRFLVPEEQDAALLNIVKQYSSKPFKGSLVFDTILSSKKTNAQKVKALKKELSNWGDSVILDMKMNKISYKNNATRRVLAKFRNEFKLLESLGKRPKEEDVADFEKYSQKETEQYKYIVKQWVNNYAINSFFLNQIVLGDEAQFGNPFKVVKRFKIAFAPGYKGFINARYGMKDRFRAIIANDPTASPFDYMSEEEKSALESDLKAIMGTEFENFDMADAQGFILPERLSDIRKGFSGGIRIGTVLKPVYFGVDEYGSTNALKYSAVVLSDSLVANHPKLGQLREAMRAIQADEYIFKTANKVGGPAKLAGNGYVDNKVTLDGKFNEALQFSEDNIITLQNQNYRIQLDPQAGLNKLVSNPTQLAYYIDSNGLNPTAAQEYYELMGEEFKLGLETFGRDLGGRSEATGSISERPLPGQIRTMRHKTRELVKRSAAKLESSQKEYEILATKLDNKYAIGINFPGVASKVFSLLLAKVKTLTIKVKFPGYKMVLQSPYGVEVYEENGTAKTKDAIENFDEKIQAGLIKERPLKHITADRPYIEVLMPSVHQDKFKVGDEVYDSNLLGFRIPSTELHSAVALKVVGFYDAHKTNVLVAPKELVPIHGSDFDVDSLFVIRKAHMSDKEKSGKPKYANSEEGYKIGDAVVISNEESLGMPKKARVLASLISHSERFSELLKEQVLLKAKKDQTAETKEALDKVNAEMGEINKSRTMARNIISAINKNRMLDIYLGVIQNPVNRSSILTPIDMNNFKGVNRTEFPSLFDVLSEALGVKVQPGHSQLYKPVNLMNPLDERYMHQSNKEGAALTATFADTMKALIYAMKGAEDPSNIVFIEEASVEEGESDQILSYSIDGTEYSNLRRYAKGTDVNGKQTEEYVYGTLDSTVNASIDNANEQILNIVNLTKDTAGIFSMMIGQGVPLNKAGLFLNQPAIRTATQTPGKSRFISNLASVKELLIEAIIQTNPGYNLDIIEADLTKKDITTKDLMDGAGRSNILGGGNTLEDLTGKGNYEAMLAQLRVVSLAERLSNMSPVLVSLIKVLSVVKTLPGTLAEFEDLKKSIDKVFIRNEETGKLEFNPKFPLQLRDLTTKLPHFNAALEVIEQFDVFTGHTMHLSHPKMLELANRVGREFKADRESKQTQSEKLFKIRTEFIKYIASGVSQYTTINEPSYEIDGAFGKIVFGGTRAFISRLTETVKSMPKTERFNNKFLSGLNVRRDATGREYLKFDGADGISQSDLIDIYEDFEKIDPSLKESIVKYAIVSEGMLFGPGNVTMVINPKYFAEVEKERTKLMDDLFPAESASAATKEDAEKKLNNILDHFILDFAKYNPGNVQEMFSKKYNGELVTETIKGKSKLVARRVRELSGNVPRVAFSFEVLGSAPDYLSNGRYGDLYRKVLTLPGTEQGDSHFFVKVGSTQSGVSLYSFDLKLLSKGYSIGTAFRPDLPIFRTDNLSSTEVRVLGNYYGLSKGMKVGLTIHSDDSRANVAVAEITDIKKGNNEIILSLSPEREMLSGEPATIEGNLVKLRYKENNQC